MSTRLLPLLLLLLAAPLHAQVVRGRLVDQTTGDPLEVRLLASGSSHLAFVFNHAAQQASATVRVRLALGGRTARDLATGAAVSVAPTADGFEWRESLPAREVRVLVIGDDQAARRKPAS